MQTQFALECHRDFRRLHSLLVQDTKDNGSLPLANPILAKEAANKRMDAEKRVAFS